MVTCDLSISLDGFVAGRAQSPEAPLGEGGEELHRWMFEQPEANRAELEGILAARAYIMGRNMFASGRGDWDLEWRGWWGDDPPYHAPVFVLTHHPREPVVMDGGTTFHFVTEGLGTALGLAKEAAGAGDVAVAGGAETVRQYLRAGAIGELRLHVAPILLGAGEPLFTDLGDATFAPVASHANELVTHVTYRVG